ncbi:MAG TPA: argininosuccinate lyase [Candidatus Thermoplasmatota archaeon]|nr:argininosuccinate lyase [Candidatus Thermoplasmatota archaeon]
MTGDAAGKAWGGRFSTPPAPDLEAMSSSLAEDEHLIPYDIQGSLAHVQNLLRARVLTPEEAETLSRGLRTVYHQLESGSAKLLPDHEDVHMNVEQLLAKAVGPVAGKLHTARSRNDQVALDLRLWTRDATLSLARASVRLALALADQATTHVDTPLPGFTHLQPAQPVTLGHQLTAHAWRAVRDAERALQAFDRANVSPLGACALAGTSFPLEPALVAGLLGMDRAFENSLDAVSDRDFALEAAFAASVASTHLSGLSEELILWASPQYGWVTLPEAYTTGSSIMPQKRNPDALELARARAGRVQADLQAIFTITKGLPLAYNRDLQEAKAPLLHAVDTAVETTQVVAACIEGAEFHPAPMLAALQKGHLEATELADLLARTGTPFREAHHKVGRLVAEATRRGCMLRDLPPGVFAAQGVAVTSEVQRVLDPALAASAKTSPGGTAPERVAERLRDLRATLGRLDGEIQERACKTARALELLSGETKA